MRRGDRPRDDSMKIQSLRNPLDLIREAITATDHNHTSQSHPDRIYPSDATDTLSCTRRRWAVEYLPNQPADTTVTISDLAEHVAARENDCTVTELSSRPRERV